MSLLLSTNCEHSLFNVLHWDAWTNLPCIREGNVIKCLTWFHVHCDQPNQASPSFVGDVAEDKPDLLPPGMCRSVSTHEEGGEASHTLYISKDSALFVLEIRGEAELWLFLSYGVACTKISQSHSLCATSFSWSDARSDSVAVITWATKLYINLQICLVFLLVYGMRGFLLPNSSQYLSYTSTNHWGVWIMSLINKRAAVLPQLLCFSLHIICSEYHSGDCKFLALIPLIQIELYLKKKKCPEEWGIWGCWGVFCPFVACCGFVLLLF